MTAAGARLRLRARDGSSSSCQFHHTQHVESQSEWQRTAEIDGESTSALWPTLEDRGRTEQHSMHSDIRMGQSSAALRCRGVRGRPQCMPVLTRCVASSSDVIASPQRSQPYSCRTCRDRPAIPLRVTAADRTPRGGSYAEIFGGLAPPFPSLHHHHHHHHRHFQSGLNGENYRKDHCSGCLLYTSPSPRD